jgi:hypothetical protein
LSLIFPKLLLRASQDRSANFNLEDFHVLLIGDSKAQLLEARAARQFMHEQASPDIQ